MTNPFPPEKNYTNFDHYYYSLQYKKNTKDLIDSRSYAHKLSSCEITAWKKKPSGLNGIRTHDFCDIGARLYQLSYQANWELVTL